MKKKKLVKKEVRVEPRILSLDYETSPQKGYFFGPIWETNIIEVIEHTTILCVGYKWDDGPVKVIGQSDFKDYKKGVLNDESLVKFFAPLLKEADIDEKTIFYGMEDIVTNHILWRIFGAIKHLTPSVVQFYRLPADKIHGVVTRVEM